MTLEEKIKKWLTDAKLEMTDVNVKALEKLFNDHLEGEFIPKTKFNELNDKYKAEKDAKDEAVKQIGTLKTFEGTNEELKTKIKTMEDERKQSERDANAKLENLRKASAVKVQLIQDKAHDPDLTASQLDLEKITVDDNGKITGGYKDQITSLKKDKPFLFKTEQPANKTPGGKPDWFLSGNKPGSNQEEQPDHELTEAESIIKGVIEKGKADSKTVQVGPDYYFKPAPAAKKE